MSVGGLYILKFKPRLAVRAVRNNADRCDFSELGGILHTPNSKMRRAYATTNSKQGIYCGWKVKVTNSTFRISI